MSMKLSLFAALACCAAAACPGVSSSQEPRPNAAVLGNSRGVYLVDFESGTAVALPIKAASAAQMLVSPDRSHVAVLDPSGLTVYAVAGGQVRSLGNITRSVDAQAAWSADSATLAFIQLAGNKTQVCIWSRATGAVKVIL